MSDRFIMELTISSLIVITSCNDSSFPCVPVEMVVSQTDVVKYLDENQMIFHKAACYERLGEFLYRCNVII